MTVTYFLNQMGPMSNRLFDETGIEWAGGRIDIHDGTEYGSEYAMPLIPLDQWRKLANFLDKYETETVAPFRLILAEFGSPMWWYKEPDAWILEQCCEKIS